MNTETYQNKKITTAGDSNSKTGELNVGKSNTYQRPIFIIAGSLLALLVWIAVLGKSVGQDFKSSAQEITEGTSALVDYQVDSANLALTKDIFDLDADEGKTCGLGPFGSCIFTCNCACSFCTC
mmetsp:Transcript_28085/g.30273  ORF Transcript_28085/g.30273 Transcript_28085/m.30273 type:complete len:124 (+) Transcript_28085:57-428(+)